MSPRPTRLVAVAAARLAEAGVPSPRADAELLLAHVLDVDRGRLVLADDATGDQEAAYGALVARRAAREPLQHILGHADFGTLRLAVGPGVFVPRPETELLAAWAASVARPGARIVDLCAGSGALGLYLAATVPGARVALVERDPRALEYLRRNAPSTVTVLAADVRDPALPGLIGDELGGADLVVSNPPYVPDGAPLDAEAAADPHDALFSGPDGLDLLRDLAPLAARLLASGGHVGMEHDDANGAGAAELLRRAGFAAVTEHRDLAGRPRYVTGRMDA
ncbi:peptide chain release factor N(5)-glutamine methyltransferase [Tsukamurella sp. 1534]|uniref:peptide chain release factor N(5)-glutamine methyltransferase n=1 Tax=Tsukamurella sp. 1534 TaxID=1151061 RepID=UPI00031D753A|nr:peptide chain release factor N(5)-glutamine methyltransferase [Tsukamurella sp. 1534]